MFSALVNKGNVLFARNEFEKAREFFKEALSNDSSCVEALYNLGKLFFSVPHFSTMPKAYSMFTVHYRISSWFL